MHGDDIELLEDTETTQTPQNRSLDETSLTDENVEEFTMKLTSELSNCAKEKVTELHFHYENTELGFKAVNGRDIELLGTRNLHV